MGDSGMMMGDRVLACRYPKAASTWLRRELERAGLATGDVRPGRPTHRGLYTVEEYMDGRLVLGSIRDPWSWHVSHYHHWLTRGGELGDRHVPWVPRWHGGMHMTAVCGDIVQQYVHPSQVDPDWRPGPWTWPVESWDEPPRRWALDRGCGMMTWAYVRTYYPRHLWSLSVDDLLDARADRYDVTYIRQSTPEDDLREALEQMHPGYEPGPAANVNQRTRDARSWSGNPLDYLSESLCDTITQRERLVCELHGYRQPLVEMVNS